MISKLQRNRLDYVRNINHMLICIGADGPSRLDYYIHVLNRKTLQLITNIESLPILIETRMRSYLTK